MVVADRYRIPVQVVSVYSDYRAGITINDEESHITLFQLTPFESEKYESNRMEFRKEKKNSFEVSAADERIMNPAALMECRSSLKGKHISHLTPEFMSRLLAEGCDQGFTGSQKGVSHYFLASNQHDASHILGYIQERYPKLQIAGMGYSVFCTDNPDNDKKIGEWIEASNADFIWVCLEPELQDSWMELYDGKFAGVMIGTGDYFQNEFNMEVSSKKLGRRYQHLFKLLKRYIIDNAAFVTRRFSYNM